MAQEKILPLPLNDVLFNMNEPAEQKDNLRYFKNERVYHLSAGFVSKWRNKKGLPFRGGLGYWADSLMDSESTNRLHSWPR